MTLGHGRQDRPDVTRIRPLQGRVLMGAFSAGVAPGYCIDPLRGSKRVRRRSARTSDCPCRFIDKHWATDEELLPRTPFPRSPCAIWGIDDPQHLSGLATIRPGDQAIVDPPTIMEGRFSGRIRFN